MSRKTTAIVLLVVGAAAIGLAFFLQAQVNHDAAVAGYLGRRASGSPGPWVVGGAGVLALLAGLLLLVRPAAVPTRPSIGAGWHDDPDDPNGLRYHDGTGWTEKRAAKSNPPAAT